MGNRIVKGALLVLSGVVLGIVAVFAALVYFVRSAPERAKDIALKASPLSVSHRLSEAQAKFKNAHGEYDRWLALTDLSNIEVDAGSLGDAKTHAEELLRLAPAYKSDWNYGNAVHKGNTTLGRLALRGNDLQKAKTYLLEAGKTPGSPQLNSFGPNMTLAKEMLDRGQKEAVLEYFQLCDGFWEMGHQQLREWTALAKSDVTPDFGANLLY